MGIEPDGRVRHHPGGWSAWRARRKEQDALAKASRRAQTPQGDAGGPTSDAAPSAPPRKRTYNEQRELRSLDAKMEKLGARKDELTAALQDAGSDYAEASRISTELTELTQQLEAAEARWLELSMIGEDD
jgi:ABC transport system ATP-binding/permease protein